MAPSRGRTLEQAIIAALAAGDDDQAAALLRHAFGYEHTSKSADLPELLEELTEYFLSQDRSEDAIAVASEALLATSPGPGDPAVLRRRCRIGEILLKVDLPDEACAVYASIAQEAPDDATFVHQVAGSDYLDAGEHELAFAWLTAGLQIALRQQDQEAAAALLVLRRASMHALALPPDPLDQRASAPASPAHAPSAEADDLLLHDELDRHRDTGGHVLDLLEQLRRARSS